MTTDDDNNTSSSSSSSHHHHHKEKWDSVFQSKDMKQVSWHRERLGMSWEMAESALETLSAGHGGSAAAASVRVLDVGAGASSLFAKQCLADARVGHVTVLDISEHALALHRTHLGTHWPPGSVEYVQGSVADDPQYGLFRSSLAGRFDLVHDRAVFHFLTDEHSQEAYMRNMHSALKSDGRLILATFALPDGPLKCSGLDIVRYDRGKLLPLLRDRFRLVDTADEYHRTPSGSEQHFVYFHLVKTH